MTGLLSLRDSIREFLRKYDEITTPILRFFAALVLFSSINGLFGYSDILGRGIVIFLISVLCALLSNGFMVFIAGIVMGVNAISVSLDVGAVYLFLFIIMYCMYIRLFPKYSWLILFTPILCALNLHFMMPLIAVVFAGAVGIIPVAFGIVLYYFAEYTKEVHSLISTAADKTQIQGYAYILKSLAQNKEMMLTIIVFSVVILITHLIYKMSFNFSWYVAIAVGGILTIIVYVIGGFMIEIDINIAWLLIGSLLGIIIVAIVQFCKGMVDYNRKEKVQYEDDEYYYYVTAIPKLNVSTKDVNVKVVNSKNVTERATKRVASDSNNRTTVASSYRPARPTNMGNDERNRK